MKKQNSFQNYHENSQVRKKQIFSKIRQKNVWIQDEDQTPFIQIDGEDFFSVEEIQERFGVSRTVLVNQLMKKKTHFLDSQEKSHEVTWKSDDLEKFLSLMKETKMVCNVAPATFRTRRKTNKKIREKTVERIFNCVDYIDYI